MAPIVLPVPKSVFLCDDVVADPASQKIHVLGVFNAIRPAGPEVFPYSLGQLCVFLQLIGGAGEIHAHVEILNASTEELVYTSPKHPLRFSGRHSTISACFRIRDCSFPKPGVYLVEFYCQDTFVDDRAFHVLETKGTES